MTPCFSGPSVTSSTLGLDCGLAQTLGRQEAGVGGWEDCGLSATNRFKGRNAIILPYLGRLWDSFSRACKTSVYPAAKTLIFGLEVRRQNDSNEEDGGEGGGAQRSGPVPTSLLAGTRVQTKCVHFSWIYG